MSEILGRDRQIIAFMKAVHDQAQQPRKIHVYSGIEGIGKSFVLDFLRKNLAYLQDWNYLQTKPVTSFVPSKTDIELEQKVVIVPVAYLDFSAPPASVNVPINQVPALLALMRQLSKCGIQFPHATFGILLFLTYIGEVGNDVWKRGLPHDEINFASEFIKFVEHGNMLGAGIFKAGLKLSEKLWGTDFGKALRKRQLDECVLKDLQETDPSKPCELLSMLPRLFVKDIKNACAKNLNCRRMLFFFDSYEFLRGPPHNVNFSAYDQGHRDEWLRLLLTEIRSEPKCIVMLGSDVPPDWSEKAVAPVKNSELEIDALPGFDKSSARNFLKSLGYPEKNWEQALVLSKLDTLSDEFHPFTLSAVVAFSGHEAGNGDEDVALAKNVENGLMQSVDRVLRQANQNQTTAVRALACCCDFDFELFQKLGNDIGFPAGLANFKELSHAAYVRTVDIEGTKIRYRIVELIRRRYEATKDDVFLQANGLMLNHFEKLVKQGQSNAEYYWIHHLRIADPQRAASLMIEILADCKDRSGK